MITGVAYDILKTYDLDSSCFRGILVPMSRSREAAEKRYDKAYASMLQAVGKGLLVVVVSVGDGGFYSTASAIVERALADGVECSMTPGIPAFIAAGSAARLPLALNDDSVVVLAQIDTLDELEKMLQEHQTVVVMKLSTVRDELLVFLERYRGAFLYAEKVGMAGQFLTTDTEASKVE